MFSYVRALRAKKNRITTQEERVSEKTFSLGNQENSGITMERQGEILRYYVITPWVLICMDLMTKESFSAYPKFSLKLTFLPPDTNFFAYVLPTY